MDTMMDILGSFVIGGMVLLAVITLNIDMSESAGQMTLDLLVQENTVELIRNIEHDLYKIGYHVPGDTAIVEADPTSIEFLADIDNNGTVDVLQYYEGSPDELTSTPNPRDRFLYRVVNAELPKASNMGVVSFQLKYYDAQGDETSVEQEIRAIKVSVGVESPYPYIDTTFTSYAGLNWEYHIAPMNIQ